MYRCSPHVGVRNGTQYVNVYMYLHIHTYTHTHTQSLSHTHTTHTCCFVGAQVCAESRQSAHRIFKSDLHSCGYAPFLTQSPAPTASGKRKEFVDETFVGKKRTAMHTHADMHYFVYTIPHPQHLLRGESSWMGSW